MIIQEMSESDCLNVLARAKLGRLACAHECQPYVVPIYFAYGSRCLYGFTTPGKKVEWMRSNPLVCVELDEVDDSDQWMSIVIFGKYEELPDTPQDHIHALGRRIDRPMWSGSERLHAHEMLQQYAGWWEPGYASCIYRSSEQPLAPIFYRIRIDRISGRRAIPSPGGSVTRTISTARESENWLRSILHALCKRFAGRRGM
jgi:nitroimidazol reductase NimA-like FMN-containing flavoprotein (pyridoxamine 5'-phosphate oxidase superfamily)